MLLIDAKGDLNVLNNEKLTPLAYASETFLRSMNLIKGVTNTKTKKKNDSVFF